MVCVKRSAGESGSAYRILVHEVIRCARCEQRDKRRRHHPRSLDMQEEMMEQRLTDKLLGS